MSRVLYPLSSFTKRNYILTKKQEVVEDHKFEFIEYVTHGYSLMQSASCVRFTDYYTILFLLNMYFLGTLMWFNRANKFVIKRSRTQLKKHLKHATHKSITREGGTTSIEFEIS